MMLFINLVAKINTVEWLIFPCFIFPFFPECYQTGIFNTGKIYTVHVRT